MTCMSSESDSTHILSRRRRHVARARRGKLALRRGFTLIELLVVIAIIAILAAMLLPVLSKARQKTVGISCMNNLKQLTIGFLMYPSDYGEYLLGCLDKLPHGRTNWVKGDLDYS